MVVVASCPAAAQRQNKNIEELSARLSRSSLQEVQTQEKEMTFVQKVVDSQKDHVCGVVSGTPTDQDFWF